MARNRNQEEAQAADPDQLVAYRKYAADAKALPEDQVKVRGDAMLALDNARNGVKKVLEHRDLLLTKWPAQRVDALNVVVPMAQACVYAADLADRGAPSAKLQARIREAFTLRDKLLSALDAAVKFDLVPADDVAKLHEGRGALNAAQSLVRMAAFFKEHAAELKDKTPVGPSHLTEAQSLGNELVNAIRPSGAQPRQDASHDLSDVANRYWTLLANGYEEVHKAGFEIWGRAWEKHVHPLGSRVVHKKKDDAEGDEAAAKKKKSDKGADKKTGADDGKNDTPADGGDKAGASAAGGTPPGNGATGGDSSESSAPPTAPPPGGETTKS